MNKKNVIFNIPEKRDAVFSDASNYWSQTEKNVPENVGTPIYHTNGTVNVGSDEYQQSTKYSQEDILTVANSKVFGNSVTFSEDGKTFASADVDESSIYIYTWDTDTNSSWKTICFYWFYHHQLTLKMKGGSSSANLYIR